jgi:hypothetical protein
MQTMRLLFALLLLIGVASSSSAQTVTDWTKTDCDGVEHNLFAELDSGCVVIMDFAMTYMGGNTVCPPCSTASAALERIKAHYDSTNPGKVHHYAMSYSDTYDCDNMNQWKEQCGFVDPCFPQCEADVKAHYGPSGMPLIVVVGPKHTILKKITSWSASGSPTNETAVQKAVDQGLAQTAAVANSAMALNDFRIVRSGTSQHLECDLHEGATLSMEVFDVLGKQCATLASASFFPQGHSRIAIPSTLTAGSYIVRVRTGNDTHSLRFIQD